MQYSLNIGVCIGVINVEEQIEKLELLGISVMDSDGNYRGIDEMLGELIIYNLINRITIEAPVRSDDVKTLITELLVYTDIKNIEYIYFMHGYKSLEYTLELYKGLENARNELIKAADEMIKMFGSVYNEMEKYKGNYRKKNKKGKQLKSWEKNNFWE